MATNLEQALAAIGGLGERGSEVPRISMKMGVVDAIDTEGRVTVRVGDLADAPAVYPNLDTIGVVHVGDTVYWLQDFSGTGLVLGSNASGPIAALPEFVAQPTPPTDTSVLKLWLDTDDNLLYAWDGAEWVQVGGMGEDFLALIIMVTGMQMAIDNGTDLTDLPPATIPYDTDTLNFLVAQGDGLSEALGQDVLDWVGSYATASQLDTNEPAKGRIQIGLDYDPDSEFWPPILGWLETTRFWASPSASGQGYGSTHPTRIDGPSFSLYGNGSSTPVDFGGYFIPSDDRKRFVFGPQYLNVPTNDKIGDYTLSLGDGSTDVYGDYGYRVRLTSAFNRTFTIPLVSGYNATFPSWFEVQNLGTGDLTLSCAGSGTLSFAGQDASGTSVIVPKTNVIRVERMGQSTWRVHGLSLSTGGLGRVVVGPDPQNETWPTALGWKNTIRFWSYVGNPGTYALGHPVRVMGPTVDAFGDGSTSPLVLGGYFISPTDSRHRFQWPNQYVNINHVDKAIDYTLALGDGSTTIVGDFGHRVRSTSASGRTFTIPDIHTNTASVDGWVEVERAGAGTLTVSFAASGTCTLEDNTTVTSFTVDPLGVVRLERTGAWTWHARGDVTGVKVTQDDLPSGTTLPSIWTGTTYQWRMLDYNGVDGADGFGLRIVGNTHDSITLSFAYIPGLAMGDGSNPADVLLLRLGAGIWSIGTNQLKTTAAPDSVDSVTRRAYIDDLTFRTITASGDTLAAADENQGGLIFNRSTAITETVPLNATVAFGLGTWIPYMNIGAGPVTFSPASTGVTISGPLVVPPYGSGWIYKTGTNTWVCTGSGSASAPEPFTAQTTTYPITLSDKVITGDATSGGFSVTLPTAVGIAGKTYTIKRINSGANNVTVATTSSQTIDGGTSWVLDTQYESITVCSDGANWLIL